MNSRAEDVAKAVLNCSWMDASVIRGSGTRPQFSSSCSCERMAAIFKKVSFSWSGTPVSMAAKWPTAIIS